jgi:hypothetical protein
MSRWQGSQETYTHYNESRYMLMATTGELRAIIEELQLIDAGDAAIYLGEETSVTNGSNQQEGLSDTQSGFYGSASSCENSSFR